MVRLCLSVTCMFLRQIALVLVYYLVVSPPEGGGIGLLLGCFSARVCLCLSVTCLLLRQRGVALVCDLVVSPQEAVCVGLLPGCFSARG